MGEKGRQIVDLPVGDVVEALKKAYLDELLSFYSYWVTEKVAEGFHGRDLADRLADEAKDELRHAGRLAERILDLGGDPAVHPKDWERGASAPWTAPREDRSDANGMIEDQINGERVAIETYHHLARWTWGKDAVTHELAVDLLQDEVRHEEFLESLVGHGKDKPHHR